MKIYNNFVIELKYNRSYTYICIYIYITELCLQVFICNGEAQCTSRLYIMYPSARVATKPF